MHNENEIPAKRLNYKVYLIQFFDFKSNLISVSVIEAKKLLTNHGTGAIILTIIQTKALTGSSMHYPAHQRGDGR